MLRALGKFNPVVSISCVEGEQTVCRLTDMFVGDKDMWTSCTRSDTSEEFDDMLADFRRAAHACANILFVSGGLLALQKCDWWVVAWR